MVAATPAVEDELTGIDPLAAGAARADALMDEAWEAEDAATQVKLAREAVRAFRECVDAHLLLAQHAPDQEQLLHHLERAIESGERILGPAAFAGPLPDRPESRTWLRALLAQGQALLAAGRADEAELFLEAAVRLDAMEMHDGAELEDDHGPRRARARGADDADDAADVDDASDAAGAADVDDASDAAGAADVDDASDAAGAADADDADDAGDAGDDDADDDADDDDADDDAAEADDADDDDDAAEADDDAAEADDADDDDADDDDADDDAADDDAADDDDADDDDADGASDTDDGACEVGAQPAPRRTGADELGARAVLVACLLAQGKADEARALAEEAPAVDAGAGPEPTWRLFTRALLAVGGAEEREALERAHEANPNVATFLLRRRRLPEDLAGRAVPGGVVEAALYVLDHGAAWRDRAGALDALARAAATAPAPGSDPEPAALDEPERAALLALPRADETWQVGARRLPRWAAPRPGAPSSEGEDGPPADDATPVRPWLHVVLATGAAPSGAAGERSTIVGAMPGVDDPGPAGLWEALAGAMRAPRAGAPRRPARIEVEVAALADALRPAASALDIDVRALAPLEPWRAVVQARARRMAEPGAPSLTTVDGPTPAEAARLARFHDAAATFYRAAPWERLDETIVRVEVAAPAGATSERAAVVLGGGGVAYGLIVAPDRARLEALRAAPSEEDDVDEDDDGPRPGGAGEGLSVLFDLPHLAPALDVDAAETHGWPIAAEDAWPRVLAVDPGPRPRAPTAAELDLLEATLRAVAALPAGAPPAIRLG